MLFSAITNIFRRKEIWEIVKKYHEFDVQVRDFQIIEMNDKNFHFLIRQIKSLSMRINHQRVFVGIFAILSTLSVAILSFSLVTHYVITGTVVTTMSFLFMVSLMTYNAFLSMCILHFNFTLYCAYRRFDLINLCIKKYFVIVTEDEDMKNIKGKKLGSESLSKIVVKLADLHDHLVDATVKMNNCFSLQMMNVIAGLFIINITSTFALYRIFVQNDYSIFNNAMIQYVWNIYFLLYGFTIISLSSLMTRTGKYTAVLVHKAINYIDDDDDPIIDYVS